MPIIKIIKKQCSTNPLLFDSVPITAQKVNLRKLV